MEVIPLTLALSLLLSLTFIALFVREFTRPRRAGAEHDSLLPLEDDLPVRASFVSRQSAGPARDHASLHEPAHAGGSDRGHVHAPGEKCSGGKPGSACCAACQRRKDRAVVAKS